MKIREGYFYFVKDEFFNIINDKELMKNKENGMKNIIFPDIDNILNKLL